MDIKNISRKKKISEVIKHTTFYAEFIAIIKGLGICLGGAIGTTGLVYAAYAIMKHFSLSKDQIALIFIGIFMVAPLIVFLIGFTIRTLALHIKGYIELWIRIATLPLTQEEFDTITEGMTYYECLEYFDKYISVTRYSVDDGDIRRYYSGFNNGFYVEDLDRLLEFIISKYEKQPEEERCFTESIPNLILYGDWPDKELCLKCQELARKQKKKENN